MVAYLAHTVCKLFCRRNSKRFHTGPTFLPVRSSSSSTSSRFAVSSLCSSSASMIRSAWNNTQLGHALQFVVPVHNSAVQRYNKLTAFTVSIVFLPATPVSLLVSPAIWKGDSERALETLSSGEIVLTVHSWKPHSPQVHHPLPQFLRTPFLAPAMSRRQRRRK